MLILVPFKHVLELTLVEFELLSFVVLDRDVELLLAIFELKRAVAA